jgi:enterochelin esterase-like enzyme
MHGTHHSAVFGHIHEQSGCKDSTKYWEAHERNQQLGENESTDIGKSQRLRQEGNARINKVLAMRPGLAKIIETVRISTYYETAKTDLHIAENTCCINYANTWPSKQVY